MTEAEPALRYCCYTVAGQLDIKLLPPGSHLVLERSSARVSYLYVDILGCI